VYRAAAADALPVTPTHWHEYVVLGVRGRQTCVGDTVLSSWVRPSSGTLHSSWGRG
jgi:hypothetical protein